MYKIANEAGPDIRIIRSDLPVRLAEIVALSIGKKPETRYQDGDQFAKDLRAVVVALAASPAIAADVTTPAHGAPVADTEKTGAFSTDVQPAFKKTIATQTPTDSKP